ncbi:MAG: DUF4412 domain-containing protein [Planctomycetota bacterium]
MKRFLSLAALTLLAAHAWCADVVLTKTKHTDATSMMGREQPAQDSTEVTWIAQDKLRVEEGDHVTIVRADQKKLYTLDLKAKTYSVVDLPFDVSKSMPPETAKMLEPMFAQIKFTVTPTTETKKIKDWTATRYTLTMTGPMGSGFTQELWATKDVAVDLTALRGLSESMLSISPMAAPMAAEMKKIDGVVVLAERTQKMMGSELKSREEVTAVETKEPAPGLYDVPKDFTEKPFDPMRDAPMGPGMGGARPARGAPGRPPTGGKPEKGG